MPLTDDKPLTPRQMARALGEKTYMGKPCPNGHDGVRYVSAGTCKDCASQIATSPEKKAYDKVRVALLRPKLAEQAKARYFLCRDDRLKACKAWVEKNKEKRRIISQNYKHRRRAQEASGVKSAEFNRWKSAQEKRCYWCHADCKRGYVVDHYTPLSKGGLHELSNLVIACRSCNARKSAQDPYIFAAQVGRLF